MTVFLIVSSSIIQDKNVSTPKNKKNQKNRQISSSQYHPTSKRPKK